MISKSCFGRLPWICAFVLLSVVVSFYPVKKNEAADVGYCEGPHETPAMPCLASTELCWMNLNQCGGNAFPSGVGLPPCSTDPNEDTNGNGILDPGEDTNGNGMLDVPPTDPSLSNCKGKLTEGAPFGVCNTSEMVMYCSYCDKLYCAKGFRYQSQAQCMAGMNPSNPIFVWKVNGCLPD